MVIHKLTRPWEKKAQTRYNDRGFYHTHEWKALRDRHRAGFTEIDGFKLSNIYCVDCYKEHKMKILGSVADHIIQRENGGKDELPNLQTLCSTHHNAKSAREKNAKYKKP